MRNRPSVPSRTRPHRDQDRTNLALAAVILGALALITWLVPACGLFISVAGLVLAYLSRHSARARLVTWGLILNGLGLLAAIVNMLLGSYLGLTGFF